MAFQKGNIKLEGNIGDLNFYKSKNRPKRLREKFPTSPLGQKRIPMNSVVRARSPKIYAMLLKMLLVNTINCFRNRQTLIVLSNESI